MTSVKTTDSVQVLFNYDYNTSEGKHITIQKGDVFTLLAKSTEEWWKVRKGDKEKFYVPANYVKILTQKQAPVISTDTFTPTNANRSNHSQSDSISIHTDIPDVITNGHGHHRNISNASSHGSMDSQSYNGSLDSQGADVPSLQKRLASSSGETNGNNSNIHTQMLNLELRPAITVSSPAETPSPEEEPVAYANMEIIQEIIAQRKESESLTAADNNSEPETWEMHTDDDTGKVYYFNSVTKETTWDSPVIKRRNQIPQHFNTKQAPASPLSKRLSRVTSFRKGWTETIVEDGQKIYVHNATGEKWHMAIDASGKEYYYKENSQESLWELPEISVSEDWPEPPTITNMERIVSPSSNITTSEPAPAPPPYATQEEPAFRLAPPVPQLRRASVDVVALNTRKPPVKAFTLPANMTLSGSNGLINASDNIEPAADSVCVIISCPLPVSMLSNFWLVSGSS